MMVVTLVAKMVVPMEKSLVELLVACWVVGKADVKVGMRVDMMVSQKVVVSVGCWVLMLVDMKVGWSEIRMADDLVE